MTKSPVRNVNKTEIDDQQYKTKYVYDSRKGRQTQQRTVFRVGKYTFQGGKVNYKVYKLK